jgi:hypothetical protein
VPGDFRRPSSAAAAKATPPRPAKKLQRFARELHSQWRPDDGTGCPPLCHHATPGSQRARVFQQHRSFLFNATGGKFILPPEVNLYIS